MKQFISISLTAAFLLLAGTVRAQESGNLRDREPAFAGSFYAAGEKALLAQLEGLFGEAEATALDGHVRCLIVPHAGYVYSGKVAASAYASLPSGDTYENIFLLAASHREYFNGVSVFTAGDYLTPLGRVRVNRTLAGQLARENRLIDYVPEAHDREHSIEVQIPLLQYILGKENMPPIIPLVIGNSSVSTSRDLARILLPYFTPENLFVISSDFSHYPSYEDALQLDRQTGEAILKKEPTVF